MCKSGWILCLLWDCSPIDKKYFEVQFYTENDTDKHPGNMSRGVETIKFFLNCISLLVGRLDKKQFENAVCESGLQTSNFLLSLVGSLALLSPIRIL